MRRGVALADKTAHVERFFILPKKVRYLSSRRRNPRNKAEAI